MLMRKGLHVTNAFLPTCCQYYFSILSSVFKQAGPTRMPGLRQVVAEYLMAVDRSHGVLEGTPGVPGVAASQRPARPRAPRERGPSRPNEAMQQAAQLYNAGHDIHDIARQLVLSLVLCLTICMQQALPRCCGWRTQVPSGVRHKGASHCMHS